MQRDEAIKIFDRYPGLPTDVRRALNRILDDHNIERTGRIELIAERDQLRAELAAAREEADSATRNWKLTQERATRWAKESTALAADNARLRKALSGISDRLTETSWRRDCDHIRRTCDEIGCNGAKFRAIEELLQAALAATSAQSLAAHDAALLREVAKLMDPDGGCYEALLSEADRIEQEAQRGQAGA